MHSQGETFQCLPKGAQPLSNIIIIIIFCQAAAAEKQLHTKVELVEI